MKVKSSLKVRPGYKIVKRRNRLGKVVLRLVPIDRKKVPFNPRHKARQG